MLERLLNKAFDILEPRIEKLVRAAVDEAVHDIADEIDEHFEAAERLVADIPNQVHAFLKKLPVIGAML
ncbi:MULTISPECIES: hypothetical protein [Mycobacterium avium complex (MAC)]|uniref:Uncharacterized protein n=1 Tax=Mycobacterium intracellulare TaxID=1767 RepID=A0AAE4RA30_MYCIT|nr:MULTISPECIES: hypothetical protein [Mycobacterium avium complex (MAC)]MCA2331625.1 hypothetical protein [Mycobacterium avium]MDV6975325.1 hypothetical protein [Mycobacterium intracellulare]MDV6980389.1 hypothetical protein [Mycobacterium intracellulare]MDV7010818.1 hypothetical protein [Mycobacterium intracellulare]MDV7025724.1 hypothetical protein [Mycobacterium intracellulare]